MQFDQPFAKRFDRIGIRQVRGIDFRDSARRANGLGDLVELIARARH